MKARKSKFGRTLRWTCAIAFGILFHLGLFWGVYWTREPSQSLKRSSRQFTKIQYFDSQARERSEILNQQMTLFDPRPLLLPTEWNAANQTQRNFIQEEQGIFEELQPMFELEDGNYLDDFGNVPANYEQLSTAQVEFDFSLFQQIGRKEKALDYQREPGFELLLKDPKSGEFLKSATIYNSDVETLNSNWPGWEPTVLLATVIDSFQVGGMSVLKSSGYEEADQLLKEQARRIFPGMGQVEDGVYLLEIVP